MYSPAVEPPAHPERQPGHRHARPLRSLSVEHPDGYIRQRRDIPAHLITSNYMALGGDLFFAAVLADQADDGLMACS
jgi:hypothetical protein